MTDDAGGIQKSLATELAVLQDLGIQIRMLARRHAIDNPLYEQLNGIHVTRLPSPVKGSPAYYTHPFNTMRKGPAAIEAQYEDWPFDFAMAHSSFWAFALAKARIPAKKLFCFHAPAGEEIRIDVSQRKYGVLTPIARMAIRKIAEAENQAISAMDCTFARSEFMHDRLLAWHPNHKDTPIPVIPLMVDTSRFSYAESSVPARKLLGLPLQRPTLLCVRRLVARMGLDQVVRAIPKVAERHPDVLLLIGGRGYLEQSLKELVVELGLEENVRFLGFISDAELPSYYAACDLFVLPTAELEGFGLVTLEAASTGRLVVATPVGGSVEVIGSFDPELLTKEKDAASLAEGILAWLERARDPGLRRQMRDTCDRLYSRDKVASKIVEVLNDPTSTRSQN